MNYAQHLALMHTARRVGVGALGPLGNAGSITAGAYKSTGSAVNVRSAPGGSVIGSLEIGDSFQADGTVDGAEVNGVYTNFAKGVTGAGQTGWVAVQYLAPAGSFNPASYIPSPIDVGRTAAEKVFGQQLTTAPVGGGGSSSSSASITAPESDLNKYLLIGAGAVAVGLVGYALFGTKKGKAARRLARVKYHRARRRR